MAKTMIIIAALFTGALCLLAGIEIALGNGLFKLVGSIVVTAVIYHKIRSNSKKKAAAASGVSYKRVSLAEGIANGFDRAGEFFRSASEKGRR